MLVLQFVLGVVAESQGHLGFLELRGRLLQLGSAGVVSVVEFRYLAVFIGHQFHVLTLVLVLLPQDLFVVPVGFMVGFGHVIEFLLECLDLLVALVYVGLQRPDSHLLGCLVFLHLLLCALALVGLVTQLRLEVGFGLTQVFSHFVECENLGFLLVVSRITLIPEALVLAIEVVDLLAVVRDDALEVLVAVEQIVVLPLHLVLHDALVLVDPLQRSGQLLILAFHHIFGDACVLQLVLHVR